jgi:hypothetical protein
MTIEYIEVGDLLESFIEVVMRAFGGYSDALARE